MTSLPIPDPIVFDRGRPFYDMPELVPLLDSAIDETLKAAKLANVTTLTH